MTLENEFKANLKIHDSLHQYVELSSDLWAKVKAIDPSSNKDFVTILISINASTIDTSLTTLDSPPSSIPFSTLLTAAIEDSDSDYTESTIALSASFLSNRGLSNRTWKDFVRFKVVDVPELCEVVLAGLSCESYESAVNDLSDAYRGFKESNFGIVSVGSILSVTNSSTPYRYKILNANPVFQGLISEQTKLTIIRGDTPHNLSDVDSVDTDDDNVDTDDLLSSSEGEEQEDLKFIDIQPCGKKEALFNVKTLADAIPQSLLYILNSYFDYSDSCIYATPFGLLRIGAFNGSLVRVKTKHDERIVRIRALQAARISRSMSSKSIFVPPILYHNLGRPSATYISIIEESAVSKAVAARIARLPTPDTNKSSVYELAVDSLKQWISAEPRMVKEGDLIMVTVDKNHAKGLKMSKDQSRIVQDNEDNEEKDPTLVISAPENAKSIIPAYFTVTELTIKQPNLTNTYLLDIGFTNIIQAAVSHTLLPSADVIAACYPLKGMTPSSSDLECIQQIRKILSTCLHPLAQKMESGTSVLIHGPPGCGKRYILKQVCSDVGIKYYEINASDLLADNQSKFAQNLQSKLDYAAELAPCVLLIRNFEMIKKKTGLADTEIQDQGLATTFEETISKLNAGEYPIVVVASTSVFEKIPVALRNCFSYEVQMEAPSESVRFHILKNLVKDKLISPDVDLKHISAQTAALTARDLKNVITQAEILSLLRVLKSGYEKSITLSNLLDIGVPITYQDIDKAMQASRTAHSDAIGAPKIPNVSWDDVGGLASVKRDILDTIQLPLEHPELFATGMKKRSGVLLYGPPGTGKTLLAKAVATSCSLNFFSVKGPELLNMYIGESEANVRRIFQKAREAKPCVIFFDELDSVAPKRGEKGDSGGVMDRIVSQLLSELDGMADGGSGDVFVIGATNRPDLLDQALLRPGRFDKLIYLGVASDHDSQLKILQALTRKFRLAPELNLMDIAEQCPFTYTGADFYALCSDAMLKAMVRTVTEIDEKLATINAERSPVDKVTPQHYLEYMATPEETDVLVSKSDFELALAELVPSVSMSEMDHYKRVQEKFNKPNDKGAKGGKKEKGKMKA